MNLQPDNNQEKLIQAERLFPTQRLFWELSATCSALGLERDASLFPWDMQCWERGDSSGQIPVVGRVWHHRRPLSGRGLGEPAWNGAAGDQTALYEQTTVFPLNPPLPPSP